MPKKLTLLRIKQARAYLDGAVAEKTLRDWIWRRKIDSVRVGRAVCIPVQALDEIIARGTVCALKRKDM